LNLQSNFTGTVKQINPFRLADLSAPSTLDVLYRLFTDPNSLPPTRPPRGSVVEYGRDSLQRMWCNWTEWNERLKESL